MKRKNEKSKQKDNKKLQLVLRPKEKKVIKNETRKSFEKTDLMSNWFSFICEESHEENMIKCMKCENWVHTVCAGVSASKIYIFIHIAVIRN